jgi:hypothetical protein
LILILSSKISDLRCVSARVGWEVDEAVRWMDVCDVDFEVLGMAQKNWEWWKRGGACLSALESKGSIATHIFAVTLG